MTNGILELKKKLVELTVAAANEAQKQGLLPAVTLPEIKVEHPRIAEHGDYATSFALKLARSAGMNPLLIAKNVARFMSPTPEIESINVAPPGFINFVLKDNWLAGQVGHILEQGQSYGSIDFGKGSRVQLEFVSGNPTGPLHVGHGRGGVLGSTLANTLAAAGYTVETEYYINDAGSQIEAFYRSLYARYQQEFGKQAEMPANGYFGAYMVDLAKEIVAKQGDSYLKLPEKEAILKLGQTGLSKIMELIKTDLTMLGVTFDNWFSEKSLFQSGQYDKVMKILAEKGYIARREGATWFVSTALGEDKDNVIVRGDGTPTYFASDIAYHYNKFIERKFDRVINIWGADHQGHVPRMKAVMSALEIDPERLIILISQLVTLKRGNELVKLSKRSGDIISLREVIEEVGKDACRFFFLSRSADSQMDFDLELAKKQSAENPVYYIQYAHARIASIMRLAEERNIDFKQGDLSLLISAAELDLIRKALFLPEIVEVVASSLEPHHLAYYAQDLATSFHQFYKVCRVVTDDAALTKARLKLVQAAKIVLARTLTLMGMNAPDKM